MSALASKPVMARDRPALRSVPSSTPLYPVGKFRRPKRFDGEVAPIWLLDADRDLIPGIPTEHAAHARRHSLARVIALQRRRWDPAGISRAASSRWQGLYVLSGLLVRRVTVGSRHAGELLLPGDVFRPWDEDHGYEPLDVSTDWLVLRPTRLAVLDDNFGARMARWPGVCATLSGRISDRLRQYSARQAISHLSRADTRLLFTMWVLAERSGAVRPDGVLVRLPLTHSVLATLIGSHRPTVTIALATLAEQGLLYRKSRSEWLLTNAAVESLSPAQRLRTLGEAA
jgi:CRP/FNR family transcriptional regulator, cyclic AMP receptor protein